MSLNYRMQGHSRSHSSATNAVGLKQLSQRGAAAVQTQSTSAGSNGSNNRSKSSITKLTHFLQTKPRIHCGYCLNARKFFHVPHQINNHLYVKYSSSQNYYYTRDINEILTNARTRSVIHFKDIALLDEEEEYFKRFYQKREYPHKIKLLTEYYKFHQDIPRLFMYPTTNILNNFHDKKRRIEYYRIANLIEEENKRNPNRPPKGIVGDKPGLRTNDTDSFDKRQAQQRKAGEKNLVGEILLKDISSFVNRGQWEGGEDRVGGGAAQQGKQQQLGQVRMQQYQQQQQQQYFKPTVNAQYNNQQTAVTMAKARIRTHNEEVSLTLQELNQKLDEITHTGNSRFEVSIHSMQNVHQEEHNLEDFLRFISTHEEAPPISIPPPQYQQQQQQLGQQKQLQVHLNTVKLTQASIQQPQPILLKQISKEKKLTPNLRLEELDFQVKLNHARSGSDSARSNYNAVANNLNSLTGSNSAVAANLSQNVSQKQQFSSTHAPSNAEQAYYEQRLGNGTTAAGYTATSNNNQQQQQQQLSQQTPQQQNKNETQRAFKSARDTFSATKRKEPITLKHLDALGGSAVNVATNSNTRLTQNLDTRESNKLSPRSIPQDGKLSPRLLPSGAEFVQQKQQLSQGTRHGKESPRKLVPAHRGSASASQQENNLRPKTSVVSALCSLDGSLQSTNRQQQILQQQQQQIELSSSRNFVSQGNSSRNVQQTTTIINSGQSPVHGVVSPQQETHFTGSHTHRPFGSSAAKDTVQFSNSTTSQNGRTPRENAEQGGGLTSTLTRQNSSQFSATQGSQLANAAKIQQQQQQKRVRSPHNQKVQQQQQQQSVPSLQPHLNLFNNFMQIDPKNLYLQQSGGTQLLQHTTQTPVAARDVSQTQSTLNSARKSLHDLQQQQQQQQQQQPQRSTAALPQQDTSQQQYQFGTQPIQLKTTQHKHTKSDNGYNSQQLFVSSVLTPSNQTKLAAQHATSSSSGSKQLSTQSSPQSRLIIHLNNKKTSVGANTLTSSSSTSSQAATTAVAGGGGGGVQQYVQMNGTQLTPSSQQAQPSHSKLGTKAQQQTRQHADSSQQQQQQQQPQQQSNSAQQRDVLQKLGSFNFTHNLLQQKNDRDTLWSERGTNGTYQKQQAALGAAGSATGTHFQPQTAGKYNSASAKAVTKKKLSAANLVLPSTTAQQSVQSARSSQKSSQQY